MHWGEHLGTEHDARAFAERAGVEVRILEKVGTERLPLALDRGSWHPAAPHGSGQRQESYPQCTVPSPGEQASSVQLS